MNPTGDLGAMALQLISSLVAVLGLMAAVFYGIRRFSRGRGPGAAGSPIRILANQALGVKKSICMVQVPGRILVLGISGDSIRRLSEIDDPEVLASLGAQDGGVDPAATFRNQLGRIMSRFSPETSRADFEARQQ